MKNKKPVWLVLGIVAGIALFISLKEETPINIVDKSWTRNGDNVSYSAIIRNTTEVDEEVTVKVIVETVSDGRGGANPGLAYSYDHKVLITRNSENKISKTVSQFVVPAQFTDDDECGPQAGAISCLFCIAHRRFHGVDIRNR